MILLEFDANNTFRKSLLDRIFYDNLKPLIKLWIVYIEKEILQDNLVSAANKANAKFKMQKSTHLDQQYFKGKPSLK